jgi:AhpC/TSA family
MRRFGWWIVAFWPLAALGQAPTPSSEPAPALSPLESIEAEAQKARDALSEKVRKTKTVSATFGEEVRAADQAYHAQMQGLMDRALTLARLHPGDPEGIAEAEWVARMTRLLRGDNIAIAERCDAAYRLLATAPVLDDSRIGLAIVHAKYIGPRCPEIEPFLRAVLSRSRRQEFVTLARLSLGSYLAETARMHDRLAAPSSGPELMKTLTKDRLDRLRAIDVPKLRGEADDLLERVFGAAARNLDQFRPLLGDVRNAAAREIYRFRHLRIGQPAPELVGEDIDGMPIRLSDFRGKVVVLSFWTTSYDPTGLIDQEKALGAAMKGRPFVLVGVNGNAAEDRAKVKEEVTKKGITWRSFWAGGPDGAILRMWCVEQWPTVYTIDADGIIRDDQVGEKLIPADFESLVHSAEEAAR